jgi:hypothetical protein
MYMMKVHATSAGIEQSGGQETARSTGLTTLATDQLFVK